MKRIAFAIAVLSMLAPAALAQDTDATASPAPPAATATDAPAAPSDDATFDANFQCPETLADNDSRIEEYARWTDWATAVHPDWNFKKRLDVRYGLLRRHACQVTLANVANSQKAPFGP